MKIYDKKQILLNNARDLNKLQIIRSRLSKTTGRIYKGTLPNYIWSEKYLGDTYGKVVLATKGVEKLGESESTAFTVLGGWCSIRTKCIRDMGKGLLTNPITGKEIIIKSISQVTQWIQNAISADQIVETIGFYQGTRYAAISEERLWTQKIINTLELYLNKELIDEEKLAISKAIKIAEEKRYIITKKYLEYILKKPINLTKIKDSDIYDSLIQERNALFDKIGVTLEDLVEPMMDRMLKKSDAEFSTGMKTKKDLMNYISSSTLVWFMYTGPYLELLKKKKYIATPKGIIIEPWSHALSNEAEAKFNHLIFTKNNSYLSANGINEDLAYIAIDEVSYYNCKHTKSVVSISGVPNMYNYPSFLERLHDDVSQSDLDLANNKSFMSGVNYLPYGKCKKALEDMVKIRDEFRQSRNEVKYNNIDDELRHEKIRSIRSQYSSLIKEQSKIVNEELSNMFMMIFKGQSTF